MNCEHCGEPISARDDISGMILNARAVHHECGARIVLGSVAHVEGRCSCYVEGAEDTDPPGMTKRQAAKAALAAYLAKRDRH